MGNHQPHYHHCDLDRFFSLNTLRADTATFLVVRITSFTSCDTCVFFNEFGWSVQLHCKSILVDEDARLGFEEAINVLQSSICCLRIQEVCDWDKGEADDSPDDPELVS